MDDVKQKLVPLRAKGKATVIGTGLVALDVIIPRGLEEDPQLRAGGTCGNVLTALAYLGWQSYPIARLSDDGASKLVSDDLRKWNVRLDYVTFGDEGSTPVIIQHIRDSKTGAPYHTFSRKCPCCGAFLPWYKAIRVADVSALVPKLPKPQVYFFDRTSPGAVALAREARELGALIFFEPSTSSEPKHLEEALELAHIVKVSSDRLGGNEAVLTATQAKLVIETQGSTGLRFRHAGSEGKRRVRQWHSMDAISVPVLKDAAGAGDWCTAGIIYMLGAMGAKGIDDVTLTEVRKAVRVGQAMAAWACGYNGPRGGMYHCDSTSFHATVLGFLNGRANLTATYRSATGPTRERHAFACELCRATEKPTTSRRIRK
jgi:fructokinase